MRVFSASGLLFDLDGVLVDSTAAVERHWHEFALRRGLTPADVIQAAHGRRSVEVIAALVPVSELEAEAVWFENLEADDTSDVVALPGAAELLNELPSRSWGVVTSCGAKLATARIRAAGLDLPRTLISGDHVSQGKPNPEGYRLGISALATEPCATAVFEDAPAGVEAGHRAGAVVVGLTTTHPAHALDADHIVEDPALLAV